MGLYIYLLAPSWRTRLGQSAYDLAKLTGAILARPAVFPVWALARRLTTHPTRRGPGGTDPSPAHGCSPLADC